MPQLTPNIGLKLFDRIADKPEKFIDYRDAMAGTGATSNANIIDDEIGAIKVDLNAVKGSGWTGQTIKGNTDAIALLREIGVTSVATSGSNTLTATATEFASAPPARSIFLIMPSALNTTNVTLSINSETAKPINKARGRSGTVVLDALEAGDLRPNVPVFVRKSNDGTRYVLVNFGEVFARDVFYDTGGGAFTTVQSAIATKANLNGSNAFTGDQSITNGSQIITNGAIYHKQTGGTANKRGFIWSLFSTSYYLSAINDVGEIVRNIAEFFHDGGMRIFGKLTVDTTLDVDGGIIRSFDPGATPQKRSYRLWHSSTSWFIQALTDAGGVVRNIIEFMHDGGVRIFQNLTVDGNANIGSHVVINNAKRLYAKLTNGTVRDVIHIGLDDKLYVGDNSIPTVIQGSGDLYFGSNRLSQDTGWKTITLAQGSWLAGAGGTYKFYQAVGDSDFVAGDVVDFEVGAGLDDGTQRIHIDTAENAGMANFVIQAENGTFYFVSKSIPLGDIQLKYRINK